jgi:hypothetical protein
VCHWHRDCERKEIVDEGVESFVHERSPWKMRYRLEFVVDEELRQHEQETKCIHSSHHVVNGPRVPAKIIFNTFLEKNNLTKFSKLPSVGLIEKRVDRTSNTEWPE